MNLPDMTGLQVFEELQKMPKTKNIPVVIVSADAMPETIHKSQDAGLHDYITKPFQVSDIHSVFNKYLEAI